MPEENGNNKRIRNEIQRFKLVVVGDGACGKTSILTKFTVRNSQQVRKLKKSPRKKLVKSNKSIS